MRGFCEDLSKRKGLTQLWNIFLKPLNMFDKSLLALGPEHILVRFVLIPIALANLFVAFGNPEALPQRKKALIQGAFWSTCFVNWYYWQLKLTDEKHKRPKLGAALVIGPTSSFIASIFLGAPNLQEFLPTFMRIYLAPFQLFFASLLYLVSEWRKLGSKAANCCNCTNLETHMLSLSNFLLREKKSFLIITAVFLAAEALAISYSNAKMQAIVDSSIMFAVAAWKMCGLPLAKRMIDCCIVRQSKSLKSKSTSPESASKSGPDQAITPSPLTNGGFLP